MPDKQLVPRFAHLEYRVLHELNISIAEYFLLDMIYHISGNGTRYAQKKLENIAFDMNISKRGVIIMRDRLIEKGLLLKGSGNKLRTSEKMHKVHFIEESELQKVHKVPKKVHKVQLKSAHYVSKTPVENNSRLTENNSRSLNLLEKGFTNDLAGYEAKLRQSARRAQGTLL